MTDAANISAANQLLQMGALLQKEKRFKEADPIFFRVYNEFPNDDGSIYAYGNNLYEMGKPGEAEKYIRQAIKINPKRPEYWLTLLCIYGKGNDGRELHRLCKNIMGRFPDYFPLVKNQIILQIENWELKENIATTDRLLKSGRFDEYQKSLISTARALALYLKGDVEASRQLIFSLGSDPGNSGDEQGSIDFQLQAYLLYLKKLFIFRESNKEIYAAENSREEIYVVGDSHALSPSYAKLGNYRFVPKLTLGVKAWHLSDNRQNRFKHLFHVVFSTIPDGALVIFNYGEIDCRLRGGIFAYHLKNPGIDSDQDITKLVADYIRYIGKQIKDKSLRPVIANVPAPNREYNLKYCQDEAILARYVQITRKFNQALKEQVAHAGYKYADFYSKTADEQGWAKPGCHIDQIHLTPDFYLKVISALV